jgi:phage terminase large subunit-like protein
MRMTKMSKMEVPEKLTVDWLLDNVDLEFEWYTPSELAFEFMNFLRLVLGEEPENTNPYAHYFLIDTIFGQDSVKPYFEARGIDWEEVKGRTAVLCCREFSKSTLIGTFLALYMAWKGTLPGYGKVNYGLYIGDSMRNNVKTTMETIEQVYYESAWLQTQFEAARFTDELVELYRLPRKKKEIAAYRAIVEAGKKVTEVPGRAKRKFVMKGVGALTGTRGTRSALQRPQFAIFDDLVPSESDANSDTVLANIESTIESDVLNALHGGGSFAIIIGTPYNKKDPVYKRIESGAWAPVVFPVCKEIRLDMKENEFVGVWEDRHSYKNVMKRYRDAVKNNATRNFMQEMMLRITSEEDRVIKDSYLNWAKRRDILKNAQAYNWYITTDYTTSGKKGNDFSGAAVWAVSNNDDRILVDIVLKKMDMEEQYQTTFDLVNRYTRHGQYMEVGVEVDGQQKAHIYSLQKKMMTEGEYFTLACEKGKSEPGITSRKGKTSKHDRFKLAVPLFQTGKIWICEELKGTPDLEELLEELRFVTIEGFGSKHDDGCDLVSMMVNMDIRKPGKDREAYVPAIIPKGEEDFWDDGEDFGSSSNYFF